MLYFILGFLSGILVALVGVDISSRGNLCLDVTEPDSPYLFVEISRGTMNDILSSKYVVFKVTRR